MLSTLPNCKNIRQHFRSYAARFQEFSKTVKSSLTSGSILPFRLQFYNSINHQLAASA